MITPFIPNQPVNFLYQPESCEDCQDKAFCQLVKSNDRLSFQLKNLIQEVSPELVTNGSFTDSLDPWTQSGGDADWQYDTGKACITLTNGDEVSSVLHQGLSIAGCKHLLFKISVAGMLPESVLRITFAGGGAAPDITEDGDYIFTINAGGLGTEIDIWLTNQADQELTVCIDNVSVKCIDAWTFCVKDGDDMPIGYIDDKYLTYTDGYISAALKWNQLVDGDGNEIGPLPDGCYKICLCDGVDVDVNMFIENADFEGDGSPWYNTGFGEDWTFALSQGIIILNDTNNASKDMVQGLVLKAGTYQAGFTAIAGGEPLLGQMTVELYINDQLIYTAIPPDATTIYSTSFTSNEDIASLYFRAYLNIGGVVGDLALGITDVKLMGDFCSDCFNVQQSVPCSMVLKWTNDTNIFDFDYSAGFTQYLRVSGAVQRGKYSDNHSEYYDNEAGTNITVFADVKKAEEMAIEPVPAYLHDAIAAGLRHDSFFINEVSYKPNDNNYQPDWKRNSHIARALVEVKKTTQNLVKSLC